MKKVVILGLCILCVIVGGALAGEGNGPFGIPESPNSLPAGVLDGNLGQMELQSINRYFAAQRASNRVKGQGIVASPNSCDASIQ